MKKSDVCKRLSIGAAGLLISLVMGCVRAPIRPVGPCTQTPRTVARTLTGMASRYRSISGHVRVKVTTPHDHYAFSGDLYACLPDKLHFDIFGFLHRPRFVMIRSGSLLYWRDFSSGRHYAGPLEACPILPARFPFSSRFLRDFMKILLMKFPPPLDVTPAESSNVPCRFTLRCGRGVFDLTVDPDRGYPLEMTGPLRQVSPLHVTFADYSDSAMMYPRRIEISMGKERIELYFKTLVINPSIPERLFVPLPSSSFRITPEEGVPLPEGPLGWQG